MTPRRTNDHLQDILDSARVAPEFIDGTTFEKFAGDKKTVFAIIRALEIIGEATKRLSDEIRKRYPHVA